MKRLAYVVSLFALLAGVAFVANPVRAQDKEKQDKEKKLPTIKEIMAKLNKAGGLHPTLARDLKSDGPEWDEIQQETKEFVKYATALGKNEPRMGEKQSWAKLTKTYAENAKAMDEAARKKDLKAAREAHAKLGSSACSACHKAHRPK